ncbi:MAG: trypsin-like peptidase domain-containing protein [Myxococcales bacterium]|nr:trypsin-like peptidase domain-containing protein [Myxococcales bacterium]
MRPLVPAPILLRCLRGTVAGHKYPIHPGRTYTIGRRPDCDVPLDAESDSFASGYHARLQVLADGRVLLTDLASRNGTWTGPDDVLVRVAGTVTLAPGDTFTLGNGGPAFRVDAGDAPIGGDDGQLPRTQVAGEPVQRLLEAEVRRSTRGLKIGLAALVVVLAMLGTAFYYWDQSTKAAGERRETELKAALDAALAAQEKSLSGRLAATQSDLDAARKDIGVTRSALDGARMELASTSARLTEVQLELANAEGATKKTLEGQVKALEALRLDSQTKLDRTEAAVARITEKEKAAEAIAHRFEKSLFMLIAVKRDGTLEGFCTAFTVDVTGLLATNAHCLDVVEEAHSQGLSVVARMNRRSDRTFRVKRFRKHDAYDGSAFSNDVALVELDLKGETLPIAPKLATWIDLVGLGPGQPIYTMGFPGKVMNPEAPSADLRAAVISRITTFGNSAGLPGDNRMVWHSALTSKGTSGSPIFNAAGEVVAINNGVLSARRVFVPDEHGRPTEDVAYDANGLNFGVRADALAELIERGL